MSLPDPHDDPAFYDHLIAKRFLAWVIDLALTALMVLVVLLLTVGMAIFIFPLLWMAIAIAYRVSMLNRFSATLGMMVAATELRHLDGRRLEPNTVLLHSIVYAFSMAFVVPQIGSIALMLNTPYKQGLNDLLLRTTVINKYIVS